MRLLALLLAAMPLLATDVNLNGLDYPLKAHPRVFLDGPSGTLSLALQASPRNTTGNPTYAAMKSATDAIIADATSYPNIAGALSEMLRANASNLMTADRFNQCSNAALLWWAAGGPSQSPIDTNGYLALAKYCITHVEDYLAGSFGCDTALPSCGRALSSDGDYGIKQLHAIAITYSIVRSIAIDATNGLTTAEVTAFLNKVLNDRDTANNGIDSTNCESDGRGVQAMTDQGAVTATIALGSTSGTFSSARTFADKGVLIAKGAGQPVYLDIVGVLNGAVSGSTSFTTNVPYKGDDNGSGWASTFYYSPPLSGNPCGILWNLKHSPQAPNIGNPATYTASYPPSGGTYTGTTNLGFSSTQAMLALGLALADDDARARTLVTQMFNYYWEEQFGFALSAYNGFNTSGPAYMMDRQGFVIPAISLMLKNSIDATPPTVTTDTLIRNQAKTFYYQRQPWTAAPGYNVMPWLANVDFDQGYGLFPGANRGATATYQWLLTNSQATEAAYVNYYLQTLRTDFDDFTTNNASYATFPFMLWDPAATQTNINTLPTQYHFTSDYTYCGTLPASIDCTAGVGFDNTVSKSGWTATDSVLTVQGGYLLTNSDHVDVGVSGAYNIGRNAVLMAGDSTNNMYGPPSGTSQHNVLITVGADTNYGVSTAPFGNIRTDTPLLRWAGGTTPTGDASNRYAYVAYNLAPSYVSGANITAAIREVAHLKKASNQDFIVSHDYVTVSSGTTIYAAWHYTRNGVACSTVMTDFDAPNREAEATTGSAAKLVSKFLPLTANSLALIRENADYTYTGGNGATCRIRTAASSDGSTVNTSATSFEEIAIHMPVDGVSGTMPTVTQPTDTNFWVAQIASSYPKVVAFGKAGTTYTSASFTSTHSGTAQYLITGLTAGTYTLSVDGTPVCSDVVVPANDNHLYCEAGPGAVTVAASAPAAEGSTVSGAVKFSGGVVIH